MDDQMKAAAYAQMYATWAFQDFIDWLKDREDSAANAAASLNPAQKEHFEGYFLAWQERKKLVAEILQHIQVTKEISKENIDDERPHQPAYGPRTESGTFPGY